MDFGINDLMKEYGLDEKEIKIYSLLVRHIELTAYAIAKATGIHRSTTYEVLERLISKGFTGKIEKGGKTVYSAIEMVKVISQLKYKESLLASLGKEFERIRKEPPSTVRILENDDGQRQFNNNLFQSIKKGEVDEIYTIGNGPAEDASSQFFLEALLNELKRNKSSRKVRYRGIWDEKFRDSRMVKLFSGLGKDKFLKNIPTKVTTAIFGDTVAYLFTLNNKPQVIEIKNKLIANENKAYFLHLWGEARE